MKIMNFSKCQFLKIIPDVSKIPNLEKLTFDDCTNLVKVHDSVGSLDKLVSLSLKSCYNLSSFLTSLKLRSLKFLDLSGCFMINHFPEIECEMKYLESINFGGTGIKELPSSIRYLIGLEVLHLAGCKKLTNLPSGIYQLQRLEELVLSSCSKLVKFPEKMGDSGQSMLPPMILSFFNDGCSSIAFPALRELDLKDCVLLELDFFRIFNCSFTLEKLNLSGIGIVTIPACIKRFVALKELYLDNCEQLQEIVAFPQNADNLKATGCMSLDLNNNCWLPELPGPGPMCIDINMEFPEKMGDSEQSMLLPTNSSVSNDGRSSILFPALQVLDLTNCVLSESDFFRIFNCSSIPACIERFVALLEERPLERGYFEMEVTGNNIPNWFRYRKEVSNSNSCEIDIDVPADSDGEITTIAFSAVVETEGHSYSEMSVSVISCGVEIYYQDFDNFRSNRLWFDFYALDFFERRKYNGHLRVKFVWWNEEHSTAKKSCGVHLVRRCEEKMIDSIDGIQVTKRPRDDDGNLESNWYPQQKRHSSSLGVRISDAEA